MRLKALHIQLILTMILGVLLIGLGGLIRYSNNPGKSVFNKEPPTLIFKSVEDPTNARRLSKTTILFPKSGFEVDFGALKDDGFGHSSLKLLITPLRHQTDYGEIHCAFYDKNHYLADTVWTNWAGNPDAMPISTDFGYVDNTRAPFTYAKCWMLKI